MAVSTLKSKYQKYEGKTLPKCRWFMASGIGHLLIIKEYCSSNFLKYLDSFQEKIDKIMSGYDFDEPATSPHNWSLVAESNRVKQEQDAELFECYILDVSTMTIKFK